MSLPSVSELLDFARAARVADGFGSLDVHGVVDPAIPVSTLITARMTYSFAHGEMLGIPDCASYAAHGVRALTGRLHDSECGGFVIDLGPRDSASDKRGYQHAFVLLAAATALRAGIPGADELTDTARSVFDRRFWSEGDGAVREGWDRCFQRAEPYWGANANMHAVEAMLAVAQSTGDPLWLERATRVATRFIDGYARQSEWMLAEHYDGAWTALPRYNHDRPGDEFRPYGITVGHLFEWGRLLVELHEASAEPPAWLLPAAVQLYATARRIGWAVDGADGFVYTVDPAGAPVVRHRPHWVVTEAIAAAAALDAQEPGAGYAADMQAWIAYAETCFLDRVDGSWHHGLDEQNRPSRSMWSGKPDVYHAVTAALAVAEVAA